MNINDRDWHDLWDKIRRIEHDYDRLEKLLNSAYIGECYTTDYYLGKGEPDSWLKFKKDDIIEVVGEHTKIKVKVRNGYGGYCEEERWIPNKNTIYYNEYFVGRRKQIEKQK